MNAVHQAKGQIKRGREMTENWHREGNTIPSLTSQGTATCQTNLPVFDKLL